MPFGIFMSHVGPRCSTAALAPIVEALMSRPGQGRTHLAPELHGYLRSNLDGLAWHPETDRLALAAGLAASLSTHLRVGQTWAYLGRLWTWRSLGHGGHGIPRGEVGHKLHQVIVPGNPRLTLSRLAHLWSNLHDTGTLSVDFSDKASVRVALTGFGLATPEALTLWGGALTEAARMAGAQQLVVHGQPDRERQGAGWTLAWQDEAAHAVADEPPFPLDPVTDELDVELEVLPDDGGHRAA